MTQQLAPELPVQTAAGPAPVNATGLVAAAAAVRGAVVAAAGLILATGLATIIWAMTPGSGTDVAVAMRGGVVGFAAANLMPVDIGGVTLSLPPLLFTMVLVVLLAGSARRGRFLPEGRYQETVSVLITALVYGVIVAATTRGFGPPGAVSPQWVWTAPAIALTATGGAMLQPGSAWHEWCVGKVPGWMSVGVRGGGVGLAVLIAGGGMAVTVGLISHFGDVVSVSALTAPSWMDGFGLAMLGLAYLPNAVIAGAGYVTGVGFEIGAGTYSPFSTVPVDLPAIPLLAAVPDAAGRSWLGMIFLVVPVAAGYLIARVAIKRLLVRSDRCYAAGFGALLTGGLLAAAVAIARGGVGDGRWSTMGSPPLLIAAAVTVEVGVIAVVLAAITGARVVPWREVMPTQLTRQPADSNDGQPSVSVETPAEAEESAGRAHPATAHPATASTAAAGIATTRRRSRRAGQEAPARPDRSGKKGRRSRQVRLTDQRTADPALQESTVEDVGDNTAMPEGVQHAESDADPSASGGTHEVDVDAGPAAPDDARDIDNARDVDNARDIDDDTASPTTPDPVSVDSSTATAEPTAAAADTVRQADNPRS